MLIIEKSKLYNCPMIDAEGLYLYPKGIIQNKPALLIPILELLKHYNGIHTII